MRPLLESKIRVLLSFLFPLSILSFSSLYSHLFPLSPLLFSLLFSFSFLFSLFFSLFSFLIQEKQRQQRIKVLLRGLEKDKPRGFLSYLDEQGFFLSLSSLSLSLSFFSSFLRKDFFDLIRLFYWLLIDSYLIYSILFYLIFLFSYYFFISIINLFLLFKVRKKQSDNDQWELWILLRILILQMKVQMNFSFFLSLSFSFFLFLFSNLSFQGKLLDFSHMLKKNQVLFSSFLFLFLCSLSLQTQDFLTPGEKEKERNKREKKQKKGGSQLKKENSEDSFIG